MARTNVLGANRAGFDASHDTKIIHKNYTVLKPYTFKIDYQIR